MREDLNLSDVYAQTVMSSRLFQSTTVHGKKLFLWMSWWIQQQSIGCSTLLNNLQLLLSWSCQISFGFTCHSCCFLTSSQLFSQQPNTQAHALWEYQSCFKFRTFVFLYMYKALTISLLSWSRCTPYLPCIVCFSLINSWDIPQKASWNKKHKLHM